MLATYDECLELIETDAIKDGLDDFRLAREEFHNLTGKFEDGEPWFELRMTMFTEWYLLDRLGPDGKRTPTERFLLRRAQELTSEERTQLEHLTSTIRSLFRLCEVREPFLKIEDLVRGGRWRVQAIAPTAGLVKDDIVGGRIIFFAGRPIISRSIVYHPHEATPAIETIVERARAESFEITKLINHFDKMRLKLDRYSNVRIQHVYRYPGDALF